MPRRSITTACQVNTITLSRLLHPPWTPDMVVLAVLGLEDHLPDKKAMHLL